MSLTSGKLTVAGLLVGAIGFVVQMVAGVTDTPTIPPGLVIILVAAGLVAFLPGRGVPLAGPAAGLFGLVIFAFKGADRLVDASPAGGFAGAWVMVAGLIVTTVAGTIATVRNYQARPATDG